MARNATATWAEMDGWVQAQPSVADIEADMEPVGQDRAVAEMARFASADLGHGVELMDRVSRSTWPPVPSGSSARTVRVQASMCVRRTTFFAVPFVPLAFFAAAFFSGGMLSSRGQLCGPVTSRDRSNGVQCSQ
ncbi:hypothetical protein [Streptomyces sp. NPDC058247]|uniref:hypothetical protein n=1 Tax=Streptomyces sp. NPDC058247 TaxID=3346401 RepID=UPI0036E0C083